ncbi:MAG: polymer-forming cytoskeletal protein [Bacteroides sp.]|nr:polymer-forming cytoskeletal protein [Bacteroides sp.]
MKLTTIAVGTILKGTINVEGSLRIDGTIEGDITCHKTVVLGPQGKVTGNVTSVSAILEGTLKGDIHITDKLILKSGCMMNGDIYTSKLEIEPTACFNGNCNTIKEEKTQQSTTVAEKAPNKK